jgi:hypothetical protein
MVATERIELSPKVYETFALPLSYVATELVRQNPKFEISNPKSIWWGKRGGRATSAGIGQAACVA